MTPLEQMAAQAAQSAAPVPAAPAGFTPEQLAFLAANPGYVPAVPAVNPPDAAPGTVAASLTPPPPPAPATEKLTKKDVVAKLVALKVAFDPSAKKEALEAVLNAAQATAAVVPFSGPHVPVALGTQVQTAFGPGTVTDPAAFAAAAAPSIPPGMTSGAAVITAPAPAAPTLDNATVAAAAYGQPGAVVAIGVLSEADYFLNRLTVKFDSPPAIIPVGRRVRVVFE